jgi:hypothetical protein
VNSSDPPPVGSTYHEGERDHGRRWRQFLRRGIGFDYAHRREVSLPAIDPPEFCVLLKQAGFSLTRVIPTAGLLSIIESKPVYVHSQRKHLPPSGSESVRSPLVISASTTVRLLTRSFGVFSPRSLTCVPWWARIWKWIVCRNGGMPATHWSDWPEGRKRWAVPQEW